MIQELLASLNDPAEVLFFLCNKVSTGEMAWENALELAASPLLAEAASEGSCQRLAKALHQASELNDRLGLSFAIMLEPHASQLANHATDVDFCRAAVVLWDAIINAAHAGHPGGVAQCRIKRARILNVIDRYQDALTDCDAALPVLRHDPELLGSAELDVCGLIRANALAQLGRHTEALTAYDAALPGLRQSFPDDAVFCLLGKARCLKDLKLYAPAVATYDAALSLLPQSKLARCDSQIQIERAGLLRFLDRAAEAVESLTAIFHEMDDPRFNSNARRFIKARCLKERAAALWHLGRNAKAIADCEAAIPGLRDQGASVAVADCQMLRAILLGSLSRDEEAVAAFEQVDTALLPPGIRKQFHVGLGDSLWRLGQRRRGLDEYTLARRALREERRQAHLDGTLLDFIGARDRAIDGAVHHALELGCRDEAFAAVQDGKASIFRDLQLRLRATPEERPQVSSARRLLVDCLRQYSPVSPATDWRHSADVYFKTWQQSWHTCQSDVSDQMFTEDPVSLERIQSALPSDWALIDFWIMGNDIVTAFVLFRDALEIRKLTIPMSHASFLDKVKRLDQSIDNLLGPLHDEALDDFYTYLFAPLRELLRLRRVPVRGLYLVPHGFLHLYPLHASRWRENGQVVYLCDRFEVAYLPSAALLPQLPKLNAQGRLFSLANPERDTPGTLPFSDWEGSILKDRFAGQFYRGSEATFARTDIWEDAAVLHFSCHGLGSASFAPLSHLRLADDLLLAHDVIYRRPPLRDGSLVILNGCETAVRDDRALDEGMGLMTAFLLRGASLVLATQWSILDDCAAAMVLTFMDALLKQGTTPTESLRRAQTRVRLMKTEEIIARLDEVLRLFPVQEYPHEAAKLLTIKADLCRRAGQHREARDCAECAAAPLRRVGRGEVAERILSLARHPEMVGPAEHKIVNFQHPLFWSAFQLVGRVT
jgi:CHAT domain-containing protein